MRRELGPVLAVAIRRSIGTAPEHVPQALALGGRGLEHDRHADPCSPRQLLLAGAPVYADLALPPLALRENLLLAADTADLASGTVLRIGDRVLLRLMFQCEACGSLDRHRPGLSRLVGQRRGMLARVLTDGPIRPGDRVTALEARLPPWPEEWRARVRRVLDALPPGHVVAYRQLADLAGIAASYCRAFPRAIAGFGPGYADKALTASALATTGLPRWDGAGLFDDEGRLAALV